MHNINYASGFLYHLPSQQILLQYQKDSDPNRSAWNLFSGEYKKNQMPEDVFRSVINNLLSIKIKEIIPVYSYTDEDTGTTQTIVFAEINSLKKFPSKKGLEFKWVSFKDVTKLPMDKQIKHDIVISQRVINDIERKNNPDLEVH